MKKNFDNAIELFTLTEEELAKINKYSLTELTEKDIFAFNVILCDNEIDRDFECFDRDALEKLAELFVGKTGILNHEMKAENQVARIYSAEVETEDTHSRLKARAYMLRSEKNSSLIDEICAGIKKEVSVNVAVSEIVCSVCGEDVKHSHCEHIKGKDCYHILKNPTDAYEWSFVAVPAQKNAGTVKSFAEKEDLEKYVQIAEKYKNFLRQEIVKLTAVVSPELSVKSVENICKSLDVDGLEQLRRDCLEAESKHFTPQLVKSKEENSNNNFLI
ncbi:MAG: hypothetical protein IKL16_01835 [Clostridia bacterium]|nr:hypothetical protein [Clostridia bacterium]